MRFPQDKSARPAKRNRKQVARAFEMCMPPEQDENPKLSLAQLEDAVKLILEYEDCFVMVSGKVS